MPSRVILTITNGRQAGTRIELDQRTCRIIGRAKRCDPRVPDPKNPPEISRYHFLLDVNPPDARVRDFGSLNGTYVNDTRIGGRRAEDSVQGILQTDDPEFDLRDGDLIRIVQTTMRIEMEIPILCCGCFTEIPEFELVRASRGGEIYYCQRCTSQPALLPPNPVPRGAVVCQQCGTKCGEEVNFRRQGLYICGTCRAQPSKLARRVLQACTAAGMPEYSVVAELNRQPAFGSYLVRRQGSFDHRLLTVLLPRVPVDARMRDRFLADLSQSQRLEHENIEKMESCGQAEGVFYFVTQFVEGQTLAERIAKGALPVSEALQYADQILQAFEYSHQVALPTSEGPHAARHGWAHLALAPDQIRLVEQKDPTGVAKVLLTRYAVDDRFDRAGLGGLTRSGDTFISPAYLPRLQLFDYDCVSPAVDVWRAAACLYAMLTQHPPRDFSQGKDPWKVVLQTAPVPIRQRNGTIPESLAKIIDYTLDDSEDFRVLSAQELRAALRGVAI